MLYPNTPVNSWRGNSMPLPVLKNYYYVMRHGESLANTAGLIVSHPENGLHDYGLSDKGRQQVAAGIDASALPSTTQVFSSDFKRARQTAEIVHQQLNFDHPINFDIRLRERHFGEIELGPDHRYADVWAQDHLNPDHRESGVESVSSVVQRALSVVLDCESNFSDETCLLIAHGDILQILQTAFYAIPPQHHRELPHLQTAEVRKLQQVKASND